MYLTYTEYLARGGTLPEVLFNDFEYEAEMKINYATFNRLANDRVVPTAVKRLMKHLIDIAAKKYESFSLGNSDDDASASITSQSNDGVSISYNGMKAVDLFEACSVEADNAIRAYLSYVKNEAGRYLLYRGLYPGE